MIQSVTQYDLMASSTCTPIGGGANTCVYNYIKKISTTTQNTPTTTVNYETVAMIESFVVIGVVFVVSVAYIVKRLV